MRAWWLSGKRSPSIVAAPGPSTYDPDHRRACMPDQPPALADLLDLVPMAARWRRHLAAGETLFVAGEPVRWFFLVASGSVRLVRHAVDGSALVLHVARAGEPVAEASLFADVYHCDAMAETATTVEACGKAALLDHLSRHGSPALTLLRHLARELQRTRDRAQMLGRRSARQRVLAYLAGYQSSATGEIALDRSWKAVAEELALTHEALYRTLAALEGQGLLVRTPGRRVRLLPRAGN
jgi:CRP-like cAMP-binding protein